MDSKIAPSLVVISAADDAVAVAIAAAAVVA